MENQACVLAFPAVEHRQRIIQVDSSGFKWIQVDSSRRLDTNYRVRAT
jgi:hypothetical protein